MQRVGIIGAGFMGRTHFDAYQRLKDRARVAAICDLDERRRHGDWGDRTGNFDASVPLSRDFSGIAGNAHYQALIDDPRIDVIDVCAPTHLHAEISVAALNAGKHVLCEKPMGRTLSECDRMIEAAERSGCCLMVAQCTRFWPEYVYLKRLVDTGEFGKLQSLHLRRQAASPSYSINKWISRPELSGGMLLDLHIHDIDFALYLLGPPRRIRVLGSSDAEAGPSRVYAFWDYETGVPILLEAFWDMPPDFPFNAGILASFERAAIVWDLAPAHPLALFHREGGMEVPAMPPDDAYLAEIRYFLDCIEADRSPEISTPADSRHSVEIALAEAEGLRTGRLVHVS